MDAVLVGAVVVRGLVYEHTAVLYDEKAKKSWEEIVVH